MPTSWQQPKTDWTAVQGVLDTDMNRIEGNAEHLYMTKVGEAITSETEPTLISHPDLIPGRVWFKETTEERKVWLGDSWMSMGGGVLTLYQARHTLVTDNNIVPIDVPYYKKERDFIMVTLNDKMLDEGIDFTVSTNSANITKISGTWEYLPVAVFKFYVFGTADANPDALGVTCLVSNTTVSVDGTINIPINQLNFNPNGSDKLKAFKVGENLELFETENWTLGVDGTSIDLVGFTANNGDKFRFEVWKKVRSDLAALFDGALIQAGSTPRTALAATIQAELDAAAAHKAEKATDAELGHVIIGTGLDVDVNGIARVETDIARFKKGSSAYTNDTTSQAFTDAFCDANSLVTIVITSATPPQGVWSVESGAGAFTITSTVAESADITFDYYLQKAVG